ncbi:hypothetical protein CCH79_00019592 [Gambusia affinis]|uniref:Uncharacterized protein n=1 Tax=Gambusia affinis TaxID=33528 RepID=A0A315V030_GAMAF|nr:hypothetical protein CCH79_00019592 [Gambusia affinis]
MWCRARGGPDYQDITPNNPGSSSRLTAISCNWMEFPVGQPEPHADVSASARLSVSVPVSACLPGPTAAIIATQLTTPYVGVAPAAGDKQLTGQRNTRLHVLHTSVGPVSPQCQTADGGPGPHKVPNQVPTGSNRFYEESLMLSDAQRGQTPALEPEALKPLDEPLLLHLNRILRLWRFWRTDPNETKLVFPNVNETFLATPPAGTATRKPEPEQEKQTDHTVKIAGSIAGVLLFIIIFLGVILLMKKRSESNSQTDNLQHNMSSPSSFTLKTNTISTSVPNSYYPDQKKTGRQTDRKWTGRTLNSALFTLLLQEPRLFWTGSHRQNQAVLDWSNFTLCTGPYWIWTGCRPVPLLGLKLGSLAAVWKESIIILSPDM